MGDVSRSGSAGTIPANSNKGNNRIDVAVLLDLAIKAGHSHPDARKEAFEEVTRSCEKASASLHHINFQRLDFGETSVLDEFYSCDSAIVDLSIPEQQNALFYHLGVRESFGMKHNILLYNENHPDSSRELRNTIPSILSSHHFVTYRTVDAPASPSNSSSSIASSAAANASAGKSTAIDSSSNMTASQNVNSTQQQQPSSTSSPSSSSSAAGQGQQQQAAGQQQQQLSSGIINSTSSGTISPVLKTYCIVTDGNRSFAADPAGSGKLSSPPDSKSLLSYRIRKLLQDVEVQTKAHMKERFLSDLRKARETFTGPELSEVLHNLRRRLDDPNVISCDTVHSMMLSFREIQDYDSMVQLIEDLESVPNLNFTSTPAILNYYAFALNRRNRKGDREKALEAITNGLKSKENYVPDIVCLCGRIYKDMFTESNYTDKKSLMEAINWYRKGFEIQQSEYAGINLATLLVVAGNSFKTCAELQRVGLILSSLIGRKGSLNSLTDYWDVAIYFEISVLAENYHQALLVCFLLVVVQRILKSQ
jgi:hypothetical protein